MKLVIIDYGSGNVESVANAISVAKEMANLSGNVIISSKILDIKSATHLILPGVGSFGDCMDGLKLANGLLPELHKQVVKEGKPLLGICVGMQVLASIGHENGGHQGLGFIDGKVEKLEVIDGLKIPHMGWNNIAIKPPKHKVLQDIEEDDHFYFANSYHFICQNENNVLASVEYGQKINAIISKKNILGIQFHPEKSGVTGLKLLRNFLTWRP